MTRIGPVGRLGLWTATHFRTVVVTWVVVAIGLVLAPRVETALSGAGWEASGSQSGQARALIDKNFRGLSSYALMVVVHSPTQSAATPAFRHALTRATPSRGSATRPSNSGSVRSCSRLGPRWRDRRRAWSPRSA
jgi:RND superfamily putative drug exporter